MNVENNRQNAAFFKSETARLKYQSQKNTEYNGCYWSPKCFKIEFVCRFQKGRIFSLFYCLAA